MNDPEAHVPPDGRIKREEPMVPEYSVQDLNRNARAVLEKGMGIVWVRAEVGDIHRPNSGHLYFTLKDEKAEAVVDAVMWRGPALRYGRLVVEGARLKCLGRVTLYEPRGRYQLVVERVEAAGLGDLFLAFEKLKERLVAEGLFAPERKRPLPRFPACVGVVTSRSGAVFHDIARILTRRFPVRIVLAPAAVQGEGASEEIARAIGRLAATGLPDVIIVGRGGGSLEDLWAFNEEAVVRAVAACPVPVVSAVGHEVDVTLSDFAADVRAATPSEAAELVAPDREEISRYIAELAEKGGHAALDHVRDRRIRLDDLDRRMGDPRRLVAEAWMAIEDLGHRRDRMISSRLGLARDRMQGLRARLLASHPRHVAARHGARLQDARVRIESATAVRITAASSRLSALAGRLEALSPLSVLARGYAIARRPGDKTMLRKAVEAPVGSEFDLTLMEGELRCRVERWIKEK